jgi:glycosyltransferase involved in cell wall biosynthesis
MSRILITTNAYPPNFLGGAELVAHEQAKILVRRGHDVIVVAGSLGEIGSRHEIIQRSYEGVQVYYVATTPDDYDYSLLNFVNTEIDNKFRKILEEFKPDVVHCHNIIGLSAGILILAKEAGASVVCTLHDHWGYCLRHTALRTDGRQCEDITLCHECLPNSRVPLRLRKDFLSLALDHVDIFLSPSCFLAERYIAAGIKADRIEIVPNGIDTVRFAPHRTLTRKPGLRLVYVGHFGLHKGVETLLQALLLLQSPKSVQLSLVGQGPREAAYREFIREQGLAENVSIRGAVAPAEMPRVYGENDLFILPSIWDENQPVSIMEAMASGVPVVASRKGGIPELIIDGINGFLVEAGNAQGIAHVLEKFLADPDLARRMGSLGRRRVIEQTYESQIDRHIAIYEMLMGQQIEAKIAKTVVGLLGKFDVALSARSRWLLNGPWHLRRYLIPLSWLSEVQLARLGRRRRLRPEYRWVRYARRGFARLVNGIRSRVAGG